MALLPAVSLEVPIGHFIDSKGIRKVLSIAVILTTLTGVMLPLSNNFYYLIILVTAFTGSYTTIFIGLYSRMSDVIGKEKAAMTGAIATFKDLGYTIGPLLAGFLIEFLGMSATFYLAGIGFILLLPIAITLHD